MPQNTPTLHLFCGKIAAGKSTLAQGLAGEPDMILLSEDDWLSRLFPDEIHSLQDYVDRSAKLRGALGSHIEGLLRNGLNVVLDFPANTRGQRRWMRGLIDNTNAAHVLHYLDVPDDVCKVRMRKRNEVGTHPFAPNEADFDLFMKYFVPPSADEGFIVKGYAGND